jgi:hypothetical protein
MVPHISLYVETSQADWVLTLVLSFTLVGRDGDLRRDFAPAELEIAPEERNPVLEARAAALLGRKGHVFDNHPSAGTIACDRSREAL